MEIRPVTVSDAEAIAEIRRQDGVREGVLGISSERASVIADFIRSLGERDRGVVAVENGEVVGFAELRSNKEESRAHSAFITVMVDREYQQRGIGDKLVSRLIECADGELALHRLELLVITSNERAIKLYKRRGFEIEATKRRAAVVEGRFADEYLMGRIRPKEAGK